MTTTITEYSKTDAEEAVQREIQRKAAKVAGAAELLEMFLSQYGDLDEFAIVTDAIKKWLKK